MADIDDESDDVTFNFSQWQGGRYVDSLFSSRQHRNSNILVSIYVLREIK